jgi:RecB family exonuclease
MTELKLFDEGEDLFELNPSKLQCYLDCPRLYRFRYIDKRPERRTFSPTSLGRSVHKALRDLYALPPGERTAETLQRSLRQAWDPTGYRSTEEAESAFSRAEEMLDRYYAGNDPRSTRVVAMESKFSSAKVTDGVIVTGRVDRLDLDEDEYVIVDYKTGRFGSDQEELDASLPLSLYAVAVSSALGREVSRIAIEHLPTGQRAETRRDAERLELDWAEILLHAEAMRGYAAFRPSPGPLCRWCDYLVACPEGRASLRVSNAPTTDVPPLIEEPL